MVVNLRKREFIIICHKQAILKRDIEVVKKTFRCSNIFFYNRTRVQAFMPQFRISEHYYGKRYKLGKFCTVNSANCTESALNQLKLNRKYFGT